MTISADDWDDLDSDALIRKILGHNPLVECDPADLEAPNEAHDPAPTAPAPPARTPAKYLPSRIPTDDECAQRAGEVLAKYDLEGALGGGYLL